MKVIIFDTETTGLPKNYKLEPSLDNLDNWPHIVQLSWIMYDTNNCANLIAVSDNVIKIPDGIEISEESIKLHKITKELNQSSGVDRTIALYKFNKEVQNCDVVVGHNISFDKRMIMVECIRNGIQQYFNYKGKKKFEFCTMKTGVDICMIEKVAKNGDTYFKYPTLTELYYTLFKENPLNVHNSFVDTLLCLRCYVKLVHNVDLVKYNNTYKQLFEDFIIDINH